MRFARVTVLARGSRGVLLGSFVCWAFPHSGGGDADLVDGVVAVGDVYGCEVVVDGEGVGDGGVVGVGGLVGCVDGSASVVGAGGREVSWYVMGGGGGG